MVYLYSTEIVLFRTNRTNNRKTRQLYYPNHFFALDIVSSNIRREIKATKPGRRFF